jgi:hypothetical protein
MCPPTIHCQQSGYEPLMVTPKIAYVQTKRVYTVTERGENLQREALLCTILAESEK